MSVSRAFTIIELVITITIIGILATITLITFSKQQMETRDKAREARATILAETLEKYYEANGEYPSVVSLVKESGTTGEQVEDLLKIDRNVIVFPGATPSTTNSISSGTPTRSTITYVASSGDVNENDACQNSTTGGCDKFTLSYITEDDSTNVTINSRRNDRVAKEPGVERPNTPTMTTSYASGAVTGTVAAVSCTQGATPQYAISSRVNDGMWSADSAWSSTTTLSLAATPGSKYGFRAKAICVLLGSSSAETSPSVEATYIVPIETPVAPVLSVTPASDKNTATWKWSPVVCPSGTTAEYMTAYFRDDSATWRPYDPAKTQTTTSITYSTNYQGYDHRARAQSRCKSAYAVSSWSNDSNSPSYIHPVAAPGNVTNFRWSTYNESPLFTWSEPACGLGATLQRRYWTYIAYDQYFADGSVSPGKATTDIFNSTRAGADAFAQWENPDPVLASELDMARINLKSYTFASQQAPGYLVSTGSPNTDSTNVHSTKAGVQLRCINTVTNRSATGAVTFSGMFKR